MCPPGFEKTFSFSGVVKFFTGRWSNLGSLTVFGIGRNKNWLVILPFYIVGLGISQEDFSWIQEANSSMRVSSTWFGIPYSSGVEGPSPGERRWFKEG